MQKTIYYEVSFPAYIVQVSKPLILFFAQGLGICKGYKFFIRKYIKKKVDVKR